ncbi:MAG: Rrf2 family transcriptional regulator [Bacteroidales bacterium]|nr:Rrf2 family transcriptional regulator [Bacteroidales bacterium]
MLSNTCKYAIRAIIYLAVNAEGGKKIGIKKISEDLQIPTPFLGKILQILAKQKILSSTKGPNGGFGIGRLPEDITLLEIVDIIDGNDLFENCLISLESCSNNEMHCALHDTYGAIRDQIKDMFSEATIANLAEKAKEGKELIRL